MLFEKRTLVAALVLVGLISGGGVSSLARAQAGRGCSVFKKCPRGFSCMPLRSLAEVEVMGTPR